MDDRAFAQGIVYDGVCLSDYFDITEPYIQPMPDITVSYTDVPGMAGAHFGGTEYGTRRISLTMSVKAIDRDPFRVNKAVRSMMPLLLKPRPRPMQLNDGREIWVVASNIGDITRIGSRGVATVDFIACDPFFYGEYESFELVDGNNTIYVANAYDVWPVLDIVGVDSGEALSVLNMDTGDKVYIPEVPDGVTVHIDMQRRRCTYNGAYLPVSPEATDFFNLIPGYNTIKLSSGSGVLTYRERML